MLGIIRAVGTPFAIDNAIRMISQMISARISVCELRDESTQFYYPRVKVWKLGAID